MDPIQVKYAAFHCWSSGAKRAPEAKRGGKQTEPDRKSTNDTSVGDFSKSLNFFFASTAATLDSGLYTREELALILRWRGASAAHQS